MYKIKLALIACALILTMCVTACAGGSRGTGVRFNRSIDQSDLNDEDDDEEEQEQKNSPWRRS
jgi:hypothetical protein